MFDLKVCIGTSCHLNGSYNVVQTFQQMIEEYSLHDKLDFKAHLCRKDCQSKGVSVSFAGEDFRIEPENARSFFRNTILCKVNENVVR